MAGLATTFGSGAMTNNIADFKNAKCILAIGTNAPEAHPVLAMKVRHAVRNGAKLIVANPMEIDFVRDAELWIRHNYGTDVALLMGMCRIILDEGLEDKEFIKERCENFDSFKEALKNYPLDWVSKTTGVDPDLLVKATRIYAQNSPATILYAMGICEHSHGTDNVIANGNLALITGNVGKPGSGVNPLRGQNNVQGACDMGALPNVFTGYQAVSNEAAVMKFETAWGVHLSRQPGMKLTEMIPAAIEGEIKALYMMGENPVITDPDAHHVREALSKLDFFVFQDIFLNETAEYAHVILPATSFAEKDGTFTNTERRVQRVRKAVEPIGESRPDWQIVCQLAKKMGAKGFDYNGPEEIMGEVARLTPSFAGINYSRLEEGSLQWPCTSEEHPGTCIMHTETFSRPSGKGNFVALKYRPPVEMTSEEYPLMLMTGRRLYHYHATMTRKVDVLNVLMNEEELKISPEDAVPLGINTGDIVQVKSKQGEVKVRATVTDAVPAGMAAMAFHFTETPTNELISARPETLDPVTGTPAYKTCPVKITKCEDIDSPMAVIEVINRAYRDSDFYTMLARDPANALKGYKLDDSARAALMAGDFNQIKTSAGKLSDRMYIWLSTRLAKGKW